MLKKGVLHLLLFFLANNLCVFSQQNYFQQEVNYKIEVSLHDQTHELSAFEKIEYINNSQTSLNFIYFHLWPNAYKDNETALAKQLLENGETAMYYAKEEDLGYIDSLNFLVNGAPIKWELDPVHPDICKLILNTPLKTLDTLFISTPFHVKLPSAKLSRLGHIGQAYAITQWYPKPAVYDKEGWHQMPYLNQGEFYSEYGSFDVSITLPENYVLAATGDRIDEPEEEQWLLSKVELTEKMIQEKAYSNDNSFPESSKKNKTIHFKQFRVHDFAWFADKRFHVLKGKVRLPHHGGSVDTWAFFTNSEPELWAKSIEYLNDATIFYSDLNGDYPYNHVTAVDGTISAGGGMEYPNITIIGKSGDDFTLESTIMHEVGHNWFYGILGSNERKYPFMDEGLNSFYEMRYIQKKYPQLKLTTLIGRDSTFKFLGLNKFNYKAQYEFSYLIAARKNTDQAISNEAPDFTNYNYGATVYSKSALAFDYLMNYLGKEKFDEAMQFYFDQWKFKHPTPTDLIQTLQYYLNADLNWFVNDMLMSSRKVDYKILSHKELEDHSHVILIKNQKKIMGPISVSGLKNGRLVGTVWYNGFSGKRVFEFPPSTVDEFKIDYNEYIPEVNRKNNNLRTHGLFKKAEPLQLNLLAKLDDPHYTQINYLPILGYNHYNKWMLGCSFYNYTLLQKKIEYTLAPMYAFGNKDLTGFADIKLNLTPDKLFQQITIGTNVKRFANNYVTFTDYNANSTGKPVDPITTVYNRISPFIEFEFKKKNPRSPITQKVTYTYNQLFLDNLRYNDDYSSLNYGRPLKKQESYYVNELAYQLINKRVINPFSINYSLQHNQEMVKTSATLNYSLTFKKNNSLDIRFFAGTFLYKAQTTMVDYRYRMSGLNGYQDYLFNYNYVGRNETNGIGFAQFTENDGAFKVWTPLGQTSKWLMALNIKSPKLGKLPLKLFADIGTSEFKESLLNDRILYNAGFEICIWKNMFEIYVPLVYSKDIKNALEVNNKGFFDTIRFTFNLHLIKPRNFISNNFI